MVGMFTRRAKTKVFQEMEMIDTYKWIEKVSSHLANEVSFLKDFIGDDAIDEFLKETTIDRFKSLSLSLKYPFLNYQNNPDNQELIEQGLLIQAWSSLGSLLESTLQLFLSFYYRNYAESDWNQWESNAIEQLRSFISDKMNEELKSIVQDNINNELMGLTGKIRKSFITQVNEILERKEGIPSLENITLSDLLDFYFSQDVLMKGNYEQVDLQKIRDYRNGIHSFKGRVIGSWEEMNNYAKVYLQVTIDMLHQLPSIPDEVPIPEWYLEDRSEILMQENEWFDYQYTLR